MRFLHNENLEDLDGPSKSNGVVPTSSNFLVTCGKDTFLKVWDLTTQHCIQTIVAHHSEIWSLDIAVDGDVLLTGSGEGEVKAWKVDYEALAKGLSETTAGEVSMNTWI
jgi:U3 small nucleolar RNA-associated protein 12